MPHRIGTYIRVSTEEQAQVVDGSIDSQQHRLKRFTEAKNEVERKWGTIVDTYIDDGYSAKDTRRPAYQRMMRDIHSGKINLILVNDVSRLSRSIHDFCVLLKDLENCKAKFLSVKEQFDTSTPAGEMMIFNMINLAQFERRQTAERVSMNFHSRALRGLLSGGNPILGFEKDPQNKGKLVAIPEEAAKVRLLFETYLQIGSVQQTAKRLSELGIGPKVARERNCRHAKDGKWTIDSVTTHLKNFGYIGKIEVNRRFKNEDQDTLKAWQQYEIVDAAWPAIVDEKVFYAAQKVLEENRLKERSRILNGEKRVFLLSGILRCGECERALMGQTSHGRSNTHRYYGHKPGIASLITCKIKRFRADEIEQAVLQHLDEMILRAGYLDKVEANIREIIGGQNADNQMEREQIQKDLSSLDREIDSVIQLHTEMAGSSDIKNVIREKLEKLAERKKALGNYLETLETRAQRNQDAKEARMVIEDKVKAFKKGWHKATPSTQKRLIRRLIESLVYTPDGLRTHYVTAKDVEPVLPASQSKKAPESFPGALPFKSTNQSFFSNGPGGTQPVRGSFIVGTGGGKRIRTADLLHAMQALYQLSYTPKSRLAYPILMRDLSRFFLKWQLQRTGF